MPILILSADDHIRMFIVCPAYLSGEPPLLRGVARARAIPRGAEEVYRMRPEHSFEEIESWAVLERQDALHLAVAMVILTVAEHGLQVLMVENDQGPYEHHFVLPHRILRSYEMIDEVAAELFSETAEQASTGIQQFWTYSIPERDPRGRVLTTAYVGGAPVREM